MKMVYVHKDLTKLQKKPLKHDLLRHTLISKAVPNKFWVQLKIQLYAYTTNEIILVQAPQSGTHENTVTSTIIITQRPKLVSLKRVQQSRIPTVHSLVMETVCFETVTGLGKRRQRNLSK